MKNCFLAFFFSILVFMPHAMSLTAREISEAELLEKQVVDRFLNILYKNPRFGTAFDRVYSFHLDQGTLDQWTEDVRQRTVADSTFDAKDRGNAELLYGLILLRRGNFPAAVDVLHQAEAALENAPHASQYLAEVYLSQDRLKEAAEALERATAGESPKVERLRMFHSLGTVYEKLGDRKKAGETWARLENVFPGDIDVLARIAHVQQREGKLAEALNRYENLVALSVQKPERRFQFQVAAADLKIRLGRHREALNELSSLLDAVHGGGWSSDFVRNRIESLFVRRGDNIGLLEFYEKRLKDHPEDAESLRRLAVLLSRSARAEEAKELLERGIARFPSHVPLRLTLVDLLEAKRDTKKALEQYEKIHELVPANPDVLIHWGRAVLHDEDVPETARREKAFGIWSRLIEKAPQDVPAVLLVADIFASENIRQEAEKLFRRALEIKPDDIELYEKLGRFYIEGGEREKGVEVLKKTAEGSRRDADSLLRLAGVFRSLDLPDAAVETLKSAVELEPNRFETRMRLIDLLFENRDFNGVELELAESEKSAESEEERNLHAQWEGRWLKTTRKLGEKIDELKRQREKTPDSAAPEIDWKLAVLLSFQGDGNEAVRCVERGLKIAPDSKLLLRAAPDIVSKTDDYRLADSIYRFLVEKDTPRRSEHLKNLAILRRDFGDSDGAVEAARKLQTVGTGNASNRRFFAEILFSCGYNDEAVGELRFALRHDPNDAVTLEMLADSLFRLGRSDEAIEMAWRLYDRAGTLELKLDRTRRLAEFHRKALRLDELLDRFRRSGETAAQQRESAFCVARIYRTVGDFTKARESLEAFFDETDVALLQELSVLAELQGDRDGAVRFQEMLCEHDAAPRHAERLLVLYENMGRGEKAETLAAKIEMSRRSSTSSVTGQAARKTPESATPFELAAWRAERSLDENLESFYDSMETVRNRFHEMFASHQSAMEESELERILGECAKSGAGVLRETANRLFTNEELTKRINDSVLRWLQASEKVQYGPRTLRIMMTVRNEKAIPLLGKEAQSRKNPVVDQKLLEVCDRLEREIYKIVKRQNELENDLSVCFEKRFPLSKIEDRSARGNAWFSIMDLKRFLAKALDSEGNFSKDINVNVISYILSRLEFALPAGSGSEERLLETACGALAAVDSFLGSESPVAGMDRAKIRVDRLERFIGFLENDLKTGKRINARKSIVREIYAVVRPESESDKSPGNIYESESLDLLKQEAEKRLLEFETAADPLDPTPLFASLVMIALAENGPGDDQKALEFLLRIPCPTSSEIKARDLLLVRLSGKFEDSAAWKRQQRESIDRLLGYRLSEDELFEFLIALKSLHLDAEAKSVRDRLVSLASKPVVLKAILANLNEAESDASSGDPRNAEQAIFLAMKVLWGEQSATTNELAVLAVDTLARHGKLDEVLGRFELQVESMPGSVEFAEGLADLYFRLGRLEDARKLAKKIGDLPEKNEPDKLESIFRYVDLLDRLGMKEESLLWTKKALAENPTPFFKNAGQYAGMLGNEGLLDVLNDIDIETISQNAFSVFRIIETAVKDASTRSDALKLLEKIWTAEELPSAARNRLRESGVRTFFFDHDAAYCPYASDWLIETLCPQEKSGDVPDIFKVWRWANHDPKTMAGSLIEHAKENGKLDDLFDRICSIIRRHEENGDSRDWSRYAPARIVEAAILFDRNRPEEGFQILDRLESKKECEMPLKTASLFLGMAVERSASSRTNEVATAYYEQAFRLNPHRAYEPFFTCKLYSLYLHSHDPVIREKGLQVAARKFQDSLRLMEEISEGKTAVGESRYNADTLVLFLEKLGAALNEAGHQKITFDSFQEIVEGRDWFETLKNSEKYRKQVKIIESFRPGGANRQK